MPGKGRQEISQWLQGLNGKREREAHRLVRALILVLGMTLQLAPCALQHALQHILPGALANVVEWCWRCNDAAVAAPTLLAMQVKHIRIWHLAKAALLVFLALLSSALTRYGPVKPGV